MTIQTVLKDADFDPFAASLIERVFPTTEVQREVWLASQLSEEGSLAYNEACDIRFVGDLRVEALQSALHGLVKRHQSLRATVGPDGTEMLINHSAQAALVVEDVRGRSRNAQADRARAAREAAVTQAFDLLNGPLFRCTLILMDAGAALVMAGHHIVVDGWSWAVLRRDLGLLYQEALGWAPSPDAPQQYADYVAWELDATRQKQTHADLAFWLQHLEGSLPVLDLPLDRPRPQVRGVAAARHDHLLDADLVRSLREAGARLGVSLYATLLTGFALLLRRLSGQDDLVIGVPAAGQLAAGMGDLVGHCVNLLPLRLQMDGDEDLGVLAKRCGSRMLDAFEHQTVTYGTVLQHLQLQRDPSRLSLVSVLFNVDQATGALSDHFPELQVSSEPIARPYENFELFVNASPVAAGMRLECQFNTGLFDEASVARWMRAYEALLRDMSSAGQTGRAIATLNVIDASERRAQAALQIAASTYDRAGRMHSAFERQVADRAGHVAVRDEESCAYTYAQLDARANQWAQVLRLRGAGRGERVGICLPRGVDLLAAVLAVLKSGAAFVPLDPLFPAGRLAFYAQDAKLALLITRSDVDAAPRDWCNDATSRILDLDAVSLWQSASIAPVTDDEHTAQPEDPAYVIYTSGSTGTPKGVVVPHRAAVNFLASMAREPGLNSSDVLAAVATFSFDMSVPEYMLPLCVGGTVVLLDRETVMDGSLLVRALDHHAVSCFQATPSMWRVLLETGWQPPVGFKAWVGAEPLPSDLALQLTGRFGEVWNLYGPTETTVWSTTWRIDPDRVRRLGVAIGRPLANTTLWILDERQQLCPLGVAGELCIGGEGVTLGYLDRPELTAERFVADGWSANSLRPIYRTGDRARWSNDGLLEHLGRMDFQVKVRGYRIELGEIEAACREQAAIDQVVVMAREDEPGDVRLAAYVTLVPGCTFDAAAAMAELRVALPEYMLPQWWTVLPAIPLLPNGKIDRRALPVPVTRVTKAVEGLHRKPTTPTERQLAPLLEDVLKMPGIGADDNFFMLGGHSLGAAQLAIRMSRAVGFNVPLRVVFEHPSLAGLAQWIDDQKARPLQPTVAIEARPRQDRARLSLMQKRLWFLEQLQPGTTVNNEPSGHRLLGDLDEAAFERAFAEMVRRQASLRTLIVMENSEPVQFVADDVPWRMFPAEDLSNVPAEQREVVLAARMREMSLEHMDLSTGPLFRIHMFRMGPQDHVFSLMVHHIIWDGWSFDLFYNEMSALYAAFRDGLPSPLAPLPVSYGDFSEWQHRWLQGDVLNTQVEFWKQRLADCLEPLELPGDRPRPAVQSGQGDMSWIEIPAATTEALRQLGQAHGGTLYTVMLTLFGVLLHQLSRRREVLIGTPVRGRNLPELESVMGFFVNSLPLRLDIDATRSFNQVLDDARESTRAAFAHPDVPFEHLVHELHVPRDESRFPIYQSLFSFQDGRGRPSQWGNLSHVPLFVRKGVAIWDLGLWFLEGEQGLKGALRFNTDIFDSETIELFKARYLHLVDEVLRDPAQAVTALLGPVPAEQALLKDWNHRTDDSDRAERVQDAISAQAARTPDAVALVCGADSLSYAALEARSNQLAHALRARGVGRGQLVGLCLERGLDMVACQLAILKAGAGYVPLDPGYPPDRLRFMAEDARLALMLCQDEHLATFAWPRDRALLVDHDAAFVAVQSRAALRADTELDAQPQDPAYVIYTSGSTGKPKGVVVPHRTVVNFLRSMAHEPGLKASDRLLAVTTLSFDIAVLELLLPLTVGARVVLASRDEAMDGRSLLTLLTQQGITALQATPSTWRMILDAGWTGSAAFKALIGGESLSADMSQELLSRTGELWNMYGPTETTVWSTCWRVDAARPVVSIGRPINNTTVHILDAHGQACPIGVSGEIWIGGDGVALGYLYRDELSAERFVADPFASPGTRMYRTGDRGRWCHDGLLEHQGRLDFQVKLRGHRIELGEIEAALSGHPGVAQAIVIVREVEVHDQRLVAYVVGRPEMPAAQLLRDHVKQVLPAYMVPQHFVALERIPLLPNGKVDRSSLPAPTNAGMVVAPHVRPESSLRTPTEQQIAEMWSKMLGVDALHREDNFFDLGGSSMLALKAIATMEQMTGKRILVRSYIFETLMQIAAEYDVAVVEPAPAQKGILGKIFGTWRGR